MKINFDSRLLRDGKYYITEKEAEVLCRQSDPNGHHIPLLPKIGWARKVSYYGVWYWLSLQQTSEGKIWTLKELD